jgi:hypothetical protein
MYFDTKRYLKSTRNYTPKHALRFLPSACLLLPFMLTIFSRYPASPASFLRPPLVALFL